jgi:hypothetical protein
MSSPNSTATPLPNQFTPLAFLPPKLAEQHQVAIYVSIAVLAVSLHHHWPYKLNGV